MKNSQYPNGKSSDPQPINHVFKQGRLKSIVEHAYRNLAIMNVIKNILPNHLRCHCSVLNLDNDVLFLQMDNAHSAIQLRYEQEQLLKQLQKFPLTQSIKKIEIKIRPVASFDHQTQKKTSLLDEQSRNILKHCAEEINIPELKTILQKMSLGPVQK